MKCIVLFRFGLTEARMLSLILSVLPKKVFSLILFQEVKDQSSSVLEGEEIRWVITVPAVWRQPAKQFMREAAYLVRHTHTTITCSMHVV